jgi:hypothetical protein
VSGAWRPGDEAARAEHGAVPQDLKPSIGRVTRFTVL